MINRTKFKELKDITIIFKLMDKYKIEEYLKDTY